MGVVARPPVRSISVPHGSVMNTIRRPVALVLLRIAGSVLMPAACRFATNPCLFGTQIPGRAEGAIMPISRVMNVRFLVTVVSLLLQPLFAVGASAQLFVATGRDTLRGLPGVEIAVEDVPPELPQAELTTTALRTAVEQRLRAGGITVYATQVANPSDAKAYVYVQLNALSLPGQLQAVAIQVHLRQTVRSTVTSSNIVNAMTWDEHTVAAVTAAEGAQLRDLVLEMVDHFVADWRAVH
jgi:hypothetical protein